MNCEKILTKIQHFIQERVANAKAKGVILGLSGGIDSALVATLCKKALKDEVFALLMPTQHSNKANLKDALKLCEDLNLKYKIINIETVNHHVTVTALPLQFFILSKLSIFC